MFLLYLLLLFLAEITAICDDTAKENGVMVVVGNYSEALNMVCDCMPNEEYSSKYITLWLQNDTIIEEKNTNFSFEKNTLIIKELSEEDCLPYQCVIQDKIEQKNVTFTQFTIKIRPYIWVNEKKTLSFTEESKISIFCNVIGVPYATVQWRFENNTINSSRARFIEHNGAENAQLVIRPAKLDDSGYYYCQAQNEVGISEEIEIRVRVRGQYRAVWPFLGMVLEVIVLLVVAYSFEQNKYNDPEEYDDQMMSSFTPSEFSKYSSDSSVGGIVIP